MLSIYLSMVDTDEKRNLLEKIYVEHRDRMFAVAMRYLHNRSDAEDAVHEAFLRIAGGKTKIFEISPNKIVAYTDIIIRNITVDMLKKRKTETVYDDDVIITDELTIEDDIISRVSRDELVGFILSLPTGQRDAMYARAILGMSGAEGAEMLGISEAAFRHRVYSAKKSIRIFLNEVSNNE